MQFKIQNKKVGDGCPTFFIAEAGVNHNGSIEIAKKLIDCAVESGADAVKFQTFQASELNTKQAPKSTYHIETTGKDNEQSWYDLLKTQEISYNMHVDLIGYCKERKIIFMSTPYGFKSADLLDELDVPAFKIASTDTNNLPLLRHIAKKGKPMILSSAMTTMDEVIEAVSFVRKSGLNELAMLQCTGNYPSKLSDSNLNVIKTYSDQLKCVIGYSDHTPNMIGPVAATALGAKIYEKHFTIDRNLPGPDHRMSLEPKELSKTIKLIRQTELALGSKEKFLLEDEKENRLKLRKSIVSITEIPKGAIIKREMIDIKRPGTGLSPSYIDQICGKKAKVKIPRDTVIRKDCI